MAQNQIYHSNLAIPPGEFLEEVLEDLGMSKEELARRMGRPASKLSSIYKGEKAITPDTAIRLEKAVGVPAHIWTGLEAEYRLTLARMEEAQERFKAETSLVTKYCYSQLADLGEVERKTKPVDKVRELHSYFGTMSLTTIPTLRRYQPAYRLGNAGEQSPEALAAWIRLGERRASRIDCVPFQKEQLEKCVVQLRNLTLHHPKKSIPELEKRLAGCGVALVLCPHFPKTKAHGATFQLRDDKMVVMITIRFRWADIFWFSLFHELGHILLHSTKDVILENHNHDQKEEEADEFARETLIPNKQYLRFVKTHQIDYDTIQEFSNQIKIHPGIVVGRLQYDEYIKRQWFNELRERYQWGNE